MPVLEPLGDQGVLARCASEQEAARWAASVRAAAPAWLLDVVQAYTTVAVFHDPAQLGVRTLLDYLAEIPADAAQSAGKGPLHHIPCCYERGLDVERIAKHTGLSSDEVIALHAGREYTVY